MRKVLWFALWAGSASVLAQYAPMGGGAIGGGYSSGYGGGGYGIGPTIARVAVAPNGFNNGLQGLGGTGGGLHGVTRWTFMGEPNALAAQFFQSAGVPVGGTPAFGAPGSQSISGYANNRLAAAAPLTAEPKEPALPPATLAGVAVPTDETPAVTTVPANSVRSPGQISQAPVRGSRPTARVVTATPRQSGTVPAAAPHRTVFRRNR